jgi:predicted transcriptional regulator
LCGVVLKQHSKKKLKKVSTSANLCYSCVVAITLRTHRKHKMQKQTQTAIIYKALKTSKFATAQQLATATQISTATVAKILWQLTQRNAVVACKVEGQRIIYCVNKQVKITLRKKRVAKRATVKRTVSQTTKQQAQAIISEAIAKLQALQLA